MTPKTETEIYDLIQRVDSLDFNLINKFVYMGLKHSLYMHQRTRLGKISDYLYSESKKFRKK